jgi:hypothetical protein
MTKKTSEDVVKGNRYVLLVGMQISTFIMENNKEDH